MLSSITPFGERGRNNRFAVTATFFVVGAVVGGAAAGGVGGALGWLVLPDEPGAILAILAALAIVGAVLDAQVGGLRLPTIARQVDENWLHKYRGWVYGLGFGAQLGAALTTIVSSAAVYLMVLAAVGTRSVLTGALIGSVFGAIRGGSLLLARGITTADELRSFHRRLASNAVFSTRAGIAAQGLLGIVGLIAIVGAQ